MGNRTRRWAAGLCAALIVSMPALAGETPKRGGTLNYVIPTDAPPSFDAHRETAYATSGVFDHFPTFPTFSTVPTFPPFPPSPGFGSLAVTAIKLAGRRAVQCSPPPSFYTP